MIIQAGSGGPLFSRGNEGSDVVVADWAQNDDLLLTGHADGTIRLWNTDDSALRREFQFGEQVWWFERSAYPAFIAFTPNASRFIVAGWRHDAAEHGKGIVTCFDTSAGEEIFTSNLHHALLSRAISNDGEIIAAATDSTTHLCGIDVQTGEVLYSTTFHAQQPGTRSAEAIAFTAGSKYFRVVVGNSEILTFDSESGEEISRASVDWRSPEQKAQNNPRTGELWRGGFSSDATLLVSRTSPASGRCARRATPTSPPGRGRA